MEWKTEIIIAEDCGRQDPVTGEWDGLMAELAYHRADVAVAALHVSLLPNSDQGTSLA